MFKKGFYAAAMAGLMMTSVAQAGGVDSTSSVPPSHTGMESSSGGNGRVIGTNKEIYDDAETASFVIRWPYVYSKNGHRYCSLSSSLQCSTPTKSCAYYTGSGMSWSRNYHYYSTHSFKLSLDGLNHTQSNVSGCRSRKETKQVWTK